MYKLSATTCSHEDGSEDLTIHCTINDNKLFAFDPECNVSKMSKTEWQKLVDACVNGTDAELNFGPLNGHCVISVYKNVTTFSCAEYSDGRGGALEVSVPASACVEAFQQIVDMIA